NSNQDKFFLSKNKLYFSIQRIIMIGLFVSLFHQGIFNQLFPFFMFNAHLRLILGGVNLLGILLRSEERRVGKECRSMCLWESYRISRIIIIRSIYNNNDYINRY